MPVVTKISPRGDLQKKEESQPLKEGEDLVVPKPQVTKEVKTVAKTKKVCQFCKNKINPYHWDVAAIRRYLNDRGRIATRNKSGCCAKHQRRLAQEIKRARHLALLPFTIRI